MTTTGAIWWVFYLGLIAGLIAGLAIGRVFSH